MGKSTFLSILEREAIFIKRVNWELVCLRQSVLCRHHPQPLVAPPARENRGRRHPLPHTQSLRHTGSKWLHHQQLRQCRHQRCRARHRQSASTWARPLVHVPLGAAHLLSSQLPSFLPPSACWCCRLSTGNSHFTPRTVLQVRQTRLQTYYRCVRPDHKHTTGASDQITSRNEGMPICECDCSWRDHSEHAYERNR